MKIEQNQTLWGIAKQSVQKQTGEQKVTNQQIVDEMKSIAKQNGYEDGDFEKCSKEKFYGELGTLKVKGLDIEHADEGGTAPAPAPEEGVEDDVASKKLPAAGEDEAGDNEALKYTTLGTATTAGTKMALKVGENIVRDQGVRNVTKKATTKVAAGTKKVATKLKGKVDAARVQRARNGQAAKIKEARRAATTAKNSKVALRAEEAKLKNLKANKATEAQIKEQEKVVAKAKANNAKATAAMKAKRKAAGLNQTTGQPLKKRKIVKTPKGQVAKASAKKAAKTTAQTAAKTTAKTTAKTSAKTTAKAAAKATGKTLLKKIPVVGLLAGVAFAVDRAAHGDYTGAAMEVGSGALSCIPGFGTAASVAVDAGIAYRDIKKG